MERLKKTSDGGCYPSLFYLFQRDRYLATVEKDVIPWLYRTGTLVKSGLTVGGRFRFPDCPQQSDDGNYGAVTRLTSSGQELNPAEKLTAAEVIKMYTLNAAYASHEEKH